MTRGVWKVAVCRAKQLGSCQWPSCDCWRHSETSNNSVVCCDKTKISWEIAVYALGYLQKLLAIICHNQHLDEDSLGWVSLKIWYRRMENGTWMFRNFRCCYSFGPVITIDQRHSQLGTFFLFQRFTRIQIWKNNTHLWLHVLASSPFFKNSPRPLRKTRCAKKMVMSAGSMIEILFQMSKIEDQVAKRHLPKIAGKNRQMLMIPGFRAISHQNFDWSLHPKSRSKAYLATWLLPSFYWIFVPISRNKALEVKLHLPKDGWIECQTSMFQDFQERLHPSSLDWKNLPKSSFEDDLAI